MEEGDEPLWILEEESNHGGAVEFFGRMVFGASFKELQENPVCRFDKKGNKTPYDVAKVCFLFYFVYFLKIFNLALKNKVYLYITFRVKHSGSVKQLFY